MARRFGGPGWDRVLYPNFQNFSLNAPIETLPKSIITGVEQGGGETPYCLIGEIVNSGCDPA